MRLKGSVRRRHRVERIIKRDGAVCWICRFPITAVWAATLDHIIPKSKGGTNHISNLRVAHKRCNNARGNQDVGPAVLAEIGRRRALVAAKRKERAARRKARLG